MPVALVTGTLHLLQFPLGKAPHNTTTLAVTAIPDESYIQLLPWLNLAACIGFKAKDVN